MVGRGVYVVSGGASGMGAAVSEPLENQGSQVIVADLSEPDSRHQVVQAIADRAREGLDGLRVSDFAALGISLNAVAPGYTRTS